MKIARSHNTQLQISYRFLLGFLVVGFLLLPESGAHQCSHGHDHHVHHHHDHDHHDVDVDDLVVKRALLPEEIAEMEDLMMEWEHSHVDHHHHHDQGHSVEEMSGIGLWINAMGCSLLVSLASLICLILLPVIFIKGTPSKTFVDCLAIFGAGAMLGDAFLHQLPHAFVGGHSRSHDHHDDHDHDHVHSGHSHSHSLQDLSVGLSILSGIILFLIVEKIVRYVEEFSGNAPGHGHHHHHHKRSQKLKDDGDANDKLSEEKESNKDTSRDDKSSEKDGVKKRVTSNIASKNGSELDHNEISNGDIDSIHKEEHDKPKLSLVFGYLNLFSDGVHNFTDGMALGSAFLLYGSVGGWSRTLFLLAHELPQEIGDFGILVRSGFSVSKALFFNFLSALVALVGTALALMWGKDPGQSSLIEGFTAGGFIYIALAGVLAEMNNGVSSSLRSSSLQLISLCLGMAVALGISLVE